MKKLKADEKKPAATKSHPSPAKKISGETESSGQWTLITGASSGIGRALAVASAKRSQNLILVSLPGENLEDVSKDLESRYKVKTRFLEIDLTEDSAPLKVHQWCVAQGLSVNRLVNNAGIINRGSFDDRSPLFYETMMRLNINAVVQLTRQFLPELKKQKSASILNLGSMACFLPVPYKTVYAATKAFIYAFTIGLREELRGSPVQVFLLCPGSVPTNQEIRTRMEGDGWLSRISVLGADRVAEIALQKMENGKSVIIPGSVNRIYLFFVRLVPKGLKTKIMARVFRKNQTISPKVTIPAHGHLNPPGWNGNRGIK